VSQFLFVHGLILPFRTKGKKQFETVVYTYCIFKAMIDLYDAKGGRKYLNATERSRFELAAREEERQVRTFCLMLLYSGCRISEALALTVKSIDFPAKSVVLRTLKKRGGKNVYRSAPFPCPIIISMS
jgi:integrase/recombinase XerD